MRGFWLGLCFLLGGGQAAGLPPGVELIQDVPYCQAGARVLTLDILRPKGPAEGLPAVVWIHGGGWYSGDKRRGWPHLVPLAQAGFFTATVAYRLSREAQFPAQIHDVKCAIRYLRAQAHRYGLNPERIGVWGGSAGGHLAALLGVSGGVEGLEGAGGWKGYSSRVQAVVVWFAPTDLTSVDPRRRSVQLLLGGPVHERLELARQASPLYYVTPDDPPFLIQHGAEDPVVPLEQGQKLYQKLKLQGVEARLEVFPGMGHGGTAFTSPRNYQNITAFFLRHLR
ncbi:alpha/beta hydrolase [Meiothermus sp. QL-1]|uniref:alpha/beta hydrolase n=1 Tax=Meiothermus sp. QL-1 TaxID=2058095 RepID=UPI0013148F6C|nr:alpha/beta hydrolase [Meiothermus sp. QL-1]